MKTRCASSFASQRLKAIFFLVTGMLFMPNLVQAQLSSAPDLVVWDSTRTWAPLSFLEADNGTYVVGFDSVVSLVFLAPIDDSLMLGPPYFLDSGYVFTGAISNGQQFFLSRIDWVNFAFGNIVMTWDVNSATMREDTSEVRYGTLFHGGVYPSRDGGGFISGAAAPLSPFVGGTLISKFDVFGNFEWEKRHREGSFLAPRKVLELENGLIYLLPQSQNFSVRYDFLTMLNAQGDSVNTLTMLPETSDAHVTFDQGIFLIATASDSLLRKSVQISKIDSAGDLIWTKNHLVLENDPREKEVIFRRSISTRDGGILVCLAAVYNPTGEQEIVPYFLKLNKYGNPIWEKTLPQIGAESIEIATMHEAADGRVFLGGALQELFAFTRGPNYLALLDSDGSFPLTLDQEVPPTFQVYPNPMTESVQIFWDQESPSDVQVRLLDLQGREIIRQEFTLSSGSQALIIPIEHVAPGLYVLEVVTGEGSFSRKVMKE